MILITKMSKESDNMIAIIISFVFAVLWYLAIDAIVAVYKYFKNKESENDEK